MITNLGDYWNLFAYLAGYGLGTLAGMHIEKMISLGHVIVRLITPDDPQSLITELSGLGYGMTRIEGSGSFSNTVTIIFMIVPRTELGRLLMVLSTQHPDILYTVEDVRNLKEGVRSFIKMPKAGYWVFLVYSVPKALNQCDLIQSSMGLPSHHR